MPELALSNNGAHISTATSCDEKYPPEHMIDGSYACRTQDTFWISTGMFPQEFTLSFSSLMNLNAIRIESFDVRNISVDRCIQNEPQEFESIASQDLEKTEGGLQIEEIPAQNLTAMHLRFTVHGGHNHFVSVHRLSVDGSAV